MSIDENSPNQIFDTVKAWMVEDGLFLDEIEDGAAIRAMVVKIGESLNVQIMIPNEFLNTLVISHQILIEGEIQDRIANLSNSKFSDFWYDFLKSLILMGIDFNVDQKKKSLSSISLQYEFVTENVFVPEYSVSKTLFMEKISVLRKAIVLLNHCIYYHAGLYPKYLDFDD